MRAEEGTSCPLGAADFGMCSKVDGKEAQIEARAPRGQLVLAVRASVACAMGFGS